MNVQYYRDMLILCLNRRNSTRCIRWSLLHKYMDYVPLGILFVCEEGDCIDWLRRVTKVSCAHNYRVSYTLG